MVDTADRLINGDGVVVQETDDGNIEFHFPNHDHPVVLGPHAAASMAGQTMRILTGISPSELPDPMGRTFTNTDSDNQ